jgi:hypothetical protein
VEVFDLMQAEDTPQCRARTPRGWVDVVATDGTVAFRLCPGPLGAFTRP